MGFRQWGLNGFGGEGTGAPTCMPSGTCRCLIGTPAAGYCRLGAT